LEQAEAKYRQEVAGSNRALEQLQAESGARLKELEAAVVDAEKQRDKESESRSRTEQELLTVREELAARLKKHTEELLGLNESLKAEMGERKRADEGLTEARAEFNRAAKAHTDELVATGEKLAALAQKRDELESRLSARGRELDEARKQLESQTAERLDFEQANQKAKDELATRLNENNRKLNELEEQLKRQNEGRQQVYARLGKALADCMTPTEAARVVSSSAQELFGWDACAIDLYSVDENRIHPVLNIDTVNGRSVDVPAGYLELGPTPLMQQVVREGPQLVLRKGSSGAHTDDILFGDRAGLSASMMCVPIRAGGKVTGFVSIQRYAPEAYNSDDLSGLEALADHLAGALERVRAEEIQRRSEERFRLVARATTDIVWDWNVPMNQIWRNDVFHTVFGYRPDEIEMGIESWESRLHPEDRERVIASLHRGLDHGEQVWSAEYRFRRADGSYAHVSDRGYAIRDKNHKAIRMVGAMVDISHHKQVEEAMIEGQARKGAILESAIDGIVTVDHEGRIFEWNPAAERMFGYRRVDVLGKELHQLIVPPALHEKYRREMGQHLAAGGGAVIGKRVELTTVRADASELPVELSISRIPTEGPPVFTGFIRDIAERKRAEMEIQKLVAFPRRNPNPVFEFAADGSLTYFNDAAQEMALSLGKEHPLAILPERTTEVVKDCLAKGQNKLRVETAINSRTISWSFFPIPTNHVVHCYAADITERTSLEAQLRQAQKMESVGQLAAGVAHDFNNILSVIQGYSALLMEEKNVKPETGEALKQINSATQRATHLTRQLLTFSRKQAMHVQTLDLNEVINSVSKLLRRVLGESIAAKFDFLSDLPPVEADTGMMEQIVMNLAINARDAMPNSGQLTVATNVSNIDEGYAEHNPEARPGRFVCLSVADSGCGMDEATLGRIFEPFFTTKPAGRGTGLGLATVYGIVKQHGGWIEVQSQIGKGTTFKIYLPASDRALTPVTESATRQVVRGGQETILLVEDEPAVLAMAGGILGRLGYTVHEAASGDHAVSVWAEHGSKIQLLLTDMVMPGELNGRQLAEKLLSERPELKVMYTSGYSVDLLGNGLASTKNFAFLQKPYHPDMLAMMVRNCLDAA
jgi:PAS domain S-box-containing protein